MIKSRTYDTCCSQVFTLKGQLPLPIKKEAFEDEAEEGRSLLTHASETLPSSFSLVRLRIRELMPA